MKESTSYENPYDTFTIKVGFIVASMVLLFILVTSIIQWKWYATVAGLLFSALMVYAIIYRELIGRPNIVRVADDGVHLEYRTRRPMYVRWDDIEWVDAIEADKITLKGKDTVEGRMKIRAKYWPMQLTYEAAHAIQMKYGERLGRYPPISPSLAQRRGYQARRSMKRF